MREWPVGRNAVPMVSIPNLVNKTIVEAIFPEEVSKTEKWPCKGGGTCRNWPR